jgi:hypothetical protein
MVLNRKSNGLFSLGYCKTKFYSAKNFMQTGTHGTQRVQIFEPLACECWTAGAAQNGIRSGIITHSAIGLKILSPYGIYAALPGLLGIGSLLGVEMTRMKCPK